jgi:thiol-disulfide isomerase/thioredoxin
MHTRWGAHLFLFCCLAAGLCLRGEARGQAQQAGGYCGPSGTVRQALREISEGDDDTTVAFVERRERGLSRLRSLLNQFPNDLFVHQRYQDAARASADADIRPLLEEYRALLSLHPHDPFYLYLYGRLLVGQQTGEAKTYMEQALQSGPDFPWPHLGLVEIYRTPRLENKAEAQAHLNAFMRACPASLQAYGYLRAVDDPEQLRAGAQRLRALLESRAVADDIFSYTTLWDIEFRASPPAQHDSVRARVESDLSRLRQSDAADKKLLLQTLREGYRLLGNAEQARRVEDEFFRLFPHTETALQLIQGRWREAHPPPDDASAPEQARAYYTELMKATDEWTRLWPHSPIPWLDRMSAVGQLGDAPAAEVEATADNLLRTSAEGAGSFRATPPVPMLLSDLYLKYNLRVERVPELVRGGLREIEQQAAREEQSEQLSPEFAKYVRQNRRFMLWRGLVMMADAYLRLKQPQDARRVLEEMSANLTRQRVEAGASPGEKAGYAFFQATYWEWQARLAEAEGRKLEAFVYYEQSLAAHAAQDDQAVGREQLSRKARQLWRELGGTDEGWELWAKRDAAGEPGPPALLTSDGEPKGEALPDFALTDLRGHTWRLADLRGKVVLINIWATWCKPCQQELPLVQRLHDSLKGRADVVVLTLNIDTDVGLVGPFLKAKGFTFPVLPAHDYVEHLRPQAIIPRTWVVSPKGVLRTEQVGFGRDSNGWMERTMSLIQSASAEQ